MTGITFLRCDVSDRRISGVAGIYGCASAKEGIET